MSIPNETCATATVVSLPYAANPDTTTAGHSPGVDVGCVAGHGYCSAWYKYTVLAGIFGVTCHLDSPSCNVTILKGSCGSLTSVACVEGGGADAIVPATEGEVIYFVITAMNAFGSTNNEFLLTVADPTGDFCQVLGAAIVAPSGLYFINPFKATKHDSYYESVEKKIPNPIIKTALVGE